MKDDQEDLISEYRNGFRNFADYWYFRSLVEKSCEFESVPVVRCLSGIENGEEQWFRNKQSGKTYRLIRPDGPTRGFWAIVSDDECP